jgi:hypothetical protein
MCLYEINMGSETTPSDAKTIQKHVVNTNFISTHFLKNGVFTIALQPNIDLVEFP